MNVQSGHTQPDRTSPDRQSFKEMCVEVFRGHGEAETVRKEGQAAEKLTVMMLRSGEREAGGRAGFHLPHRCREGDASERAVLIGKEQRVSGLNLQL